MKLMYIFGQPGSGKSTLVEELVKGHFAMPYRDQGLDLIEYPTPGVFEIGKQRANFRGTDALGMAVIGKAEEWLEDGIERCHEAGADELVMAEGDRLAVDRFFRSAKLYGYELELVYLKVSNVVAAARRHERGSQQDERWLKGRVTKVQELAKRWDHIELDGSQPVAQLVTTLMAQSDVAMRFSGGKKT